MRRLITLSLAFAAAAVALPAAAQFQKPEDAIKYRKATFTVMAAHFSRLGAMANGRVPFDAKVAAENAEIVNTLAALPWDAFGPGTDKGDTRALPAIWTEQAKYKAASDKMVAEVGKLNAAAKTGKLDQIRPAAGAVGAACKACHDSYQAQ